MLNLTLVKIVIGVVVAAAVTLIGTREFRRLRLRRLKGRQSLSGDRFYDEFYAETEAPKQVVMEVRDEVADLLEVPAELLRPTDRFDRELAPVRGWEQFWDDGWYLLKGSPIQAAGKARRVNWARIETLDDLIEEVVRQVVQDRSDSP